MQSSKEEQGEIKSSGDQCKEIEENDRMGRTKDLFKEIRDTKGIFHARMGTIKHRNSKDLTEKEEIKKKWQEYTEESYKNKTKQTKISLKKCKKQQQSCQPRIF